MNKFIETFIDKTSSLYDIESGIDLLVNKII